MTEPRSHTCPQCNHLTDIELGPRPGSFMILDGEFTGLSALAARLYCDNCGWEINGRLDSVVFDVATGIIKAGEFIAD